MKIDSLNILGQQIQNSANGEITNRVQNKLNIMNENWKVLQQHALDETCDKVENNSNTRELIQPSFSPIRSYSPDSDEEEIALRDSQQQVHLKYQLLFSDVFDWLSSCDTSLSRMVPECISMEIIKSRIFAMQVI